MAFAFDFLSSVSMNIRLDGIGVSFAVDEVVRFRNKVIISLFSNSFSFLVLTFTYI